jgi:hypothetical protein
LNAPGMQDLLDESQRIMKELDEEKNTKWFFYGWYVVVWWRRGISMAYKVLRIYGL